MAAKNIPNATCSVPIAGQNRPGLRDVPRNTARTAGARSRGQRLSPPTGPEPAGQSFALPAPSAAAWRGGAGRPEWTSGGLGWCQAISLHLALMLKSVGGVGCCSLRRH